MRTIFRLVYAGSVAKNESKEPNKALVVKVLTTTKLVLLGLATILSVSTLRANSSKPETARVDKPVECMSAKGITSRLQSAGFKPAVSNISLDDNGKPESAIQTWTDAQGQWVVIELVNPDVACILGAGEKTINHTRGVSI